MVFHGSTKARLQLNFKRIFPPLLVLYAAVSCVTATAKSAVDVDGLGPHRVALEYPIDHNLRTRFHTHTYTHRVNNRCLVVGVTVVWSGTVRFWLALKRRF